MYDPASGLDGVMVAQLVGRATMGTFFAISGFHKLFNGARRAAVRDTFREDGVYSPALMWLVPGGEFMGGLALLGGLLTPFAAFGLIIICLGACAFDGFKRIKTWGPIDRADALDDVLYLPEALYIICLVVIILIGPGQLSLDAWIWRTYHG